MSSQPTRDSEADPRAASTGPAQHAVQGLQVITTVGSEADAQRIAEALIRQRLAACVQVDPAVRSYYRWEGRLTADTEWRLVIKTTRSRWDALRQAVGQLHPYELPEMIAMDIVLGSEQYLAWMARESQADGG